MGSRQPLVGYVEAANAPTFYFDGMASVVTVGNNLHFCMYQEQITADGSRERVIIARAVMPEDAWLALRDAAEFEIAGSGRPVKRPTMHKAGEC